MGLLAGLATPLLVLVLGSVYALWFDPKDTRTKGDWRRLL